VPLRHLHETITITTKPAWGRPVAVHHPRSVIYSD
jgi:hypothetical protein